MLGATAVFVDYTSDQPAILRDCQCEACRRMPKRGSDRKY